MSFCRLLFVSALSICLSACGNNSSSNFTANNAQSQSAQPAEVQGLQGTWSGQPGGSSEDAVFLTLSQRGNRITGEGAIFRGDNPVPVEVVGSTSRRGTILDLLAAGDHQLDGRLTLQPGGQTLSGKFSDASNPQGLNVTLARAQRAGTGREFFQIQGSIRGAAYTMQVQMEGQGAGAPLEGQWQSPNLRLGENSAGGRAVGSLDCWRDWSYINLQDGPQDSLPAGTLWFRSQATSTIDPDSFLFLPGQGPVSTSGTIVRGQK